MRQQQNKTVHCNMLKYGVVLNPTSQLSIAAYLWSDSLAHIKAVLFPIYLLALFYRHDSILLGLVSSNTTPTPVSLVTWAA